MNNNRIHMNRLGALLTALVLMFSITMVSCDSDESSGIGAINDFLSVLKGELIGNDYYISEYDNFGNKISSMHGDKVNMSAETDSYGEPSSYIDITVDGKQWQHVGNTLIFAQNGLDMIEGVDLPSDPMHYQTSAGLMAIDGFVNDIRNLAGKNRIVVVYSQMGLPIGVFEGDKCTVTIPGNLPKMTRVNIDGKSLYVHKANIDIYDTELIK